MLIQKRELSRIALMIDSDDKEIRSLASTILMSKSKLRVNFSTVVAIHIALFIISLFGACYLWNQNSSVPMSGLVITIAVVLQGVFSGNYIMSVASYRNVYNESIKKLL